MTEPTPLEHARAVKLRLRAASKKAAEARKEWTGLRLLMATALDDEAWAIWASITLPSRNHTVALPRSMHAEAIGSYTLKMWAAEHVLAAAAEEWRLCLAARAAMPKEERWNLAGVERWAQIADVMARQP